MKKPIPILILIISTMFLNAQEHAFVLVDISGSSGNREVVQQAKEITQGLLLGSLNMQEYPDWEPVKISDNKLERIINGTKSPLLETQSLIGMVPFGNKDRYKDTKFFVIGQYPDDLVGFYNQYFPTSFSDGYTYIQIAQAYTTFVARDRNIENYYIFMMTDALGDQERTSSKNTYTPEEEDCLLSWNNSSSSIVKSVGSIKTQNYYIHIKKIKLVNVTPPPPPEKPEIKIKSYAGGRLGNEINVATETVTIQWSCSNCPPGIQYSLRINSTDGSPANNFSKRTTSTTVSTSLNRGKYKVSLSAPEVKGDSTYIDVDSGGGGGGFLLFLLIAGVAVGGYYFWKNKQTKKLHTDDSGEKLQYSSNADNTTKTDQIQNDSDSFDDY